MQTILFVPHMDTSFFEMLDIAIALDEQKKYRALVLIHWKKHYRTLEICKDRKLQVYLYGTEAETPKKDSMVSENKKFNSGERPGRIQSLTNWFVAQIKKLFFAQLLLYLVRFSRIQFDAISLLRKLQPECILFMADRHVGIETALISAANRKGIPSLIVPFALSESSGLAEYRLAQPGWRKTYGMISRINRVISRIRPEWVYNFEGNPLLWNTVPWLLAAEILGLMPKNPWSLGGGKAWLMAVESEYNKNNFVDQGAPSRKMRITGKPRYDRAAQVWNTQKIIRQQICDSLGLDIEKPLIVCAVPHLAEHDLLPWPEHWREMEFLFDTFAQLQPDVNTVLSLHPKSEYEKYLPRAEKFNLIIAQNISYDQLIPVCDIFVATHSSTVTLAIAAHKPTVIVDFYELDYLLFNNVPGIEIIREHENLLPMLERLFSDRDYYTQLVEGQAQAAKTWARFDGKATKRILDLIDDLVEQGKEIRKLPKRERRNMLPPWSQ